MRRWIFWVAFAIGSFMIFSTAGMYLLLRSLDLAPPTVSKGTTLTLDLSGSLPEDSLYDFGAPFLGVEVLTFKDVLDSIERAKHDSRIENLLLRVRGLNIGWAGAEEMRDALIEFKSSGKSLTAYVEWAGNLDYFLASAADTIYLHPQSILDLRGVQAEVTFMRSTLEKLGIEAEFERIGQYKNSPDVYTRKTLSDAHRQVLESIVSDLYDRLVGTVAEARSLTVDEVQGLLDRGPFTAADAKELGLADGLRYRDEIEDALTPDSGGFRTLSVAGYKRDEPRGLSFSARPRIALIYGVGVIASGHSVDDPFFGRVMGAETMRNAFKEVREDESIKAVVFRIDSPGGSDIASDVIWRGASLTMEEKPIVVSMSNLAASGGYWIATASHAIVAEPTTITGSIGIYGGKFNLSGFYEKIGFHKERVLKGDSADFWSDTRGFSEEERARFRRILEAGYNRFLERVSTARNKNPAEVDHLGQGRVWTGSQAVENGLVDEIGGLERAVALAKERAGISEDEEIELVIYPHKKSFLESLWARIVVGAPPGLGLLDRERLLESSPVLRLLSEGQPLALMPYRLNLH